MKSIQVDELLRFAQEALEAAGVGAEDARTIANTLVTTDTFGVFSHGTNNLYNYIRKMQAGGLDAKAVPTVEKEGPSWAIVNGNAAMGMVSSYRAMELATQKAKKTGIAYVGVHKAGNLASTLDELKERGVWLFGAEADGTVDLYEAPFDRASAIVIGSEGQGLSRLTRDKCDYIVSIPMRGRVNSLNASNAAAVLLFEAVRRRMGH